MQTRTKELKPPAELVEAINQSEDMTVGGVHGGGLSVCLLV
jgi:hypothetical protein